MWLIVERQHDLAHVSGFGHETVDSAMRSIEFTAGDGYVQWRGLGLIHYADMQMGPFHVLRGATIDWWIVPVQTAGLAAMYLTSRKFPNTVAEFAEH